MRKYFILGSLFALLLFFACSSWAEVWSTYHPGNTLIQGDLLVGHQEFLSGATPIVLEGATYDDYECSLSVTDPTADRTITLPNDSGIMPLTDSAAHMRTLLKANLTIPSIAAQTCTDVAVTLTGAKVNDAVSIGPPSGLEANLSVCGFVSAADTVKIRLCNPTGSAIDPADTNSWRITVIDY